MMFQITGAPLYNLYSILISAMDIMLSVAGVEEKMKQSSQSLVGNVTPWSHPVKDYIILW